MGQVDAIQCDGCEALKIANEYDSFINIDNIYIGGSFYEDLSFCCKDCFFKWIVEHA